MNIRFCNIFDAFCKKNVALDCPKFRNLHKNKTRIVFACFKNFSIFFCFFQGFVKICIIFYFKARQSNISCFHHFCRCQDCSFPSISSSNILQEVWLFPHRSSCSNLPSLRSRTHPKHPLFLQRIWPYL